MVVDFILYMEHIFGLRKIIQLHHNGDNCFSFFPWYCGDVHMVQKSMQEKKAIINRSRTCTD